MLNKKKKPSNEFDQLPMEIIHHIQSFLDGKQAAKTCILSRSWFDAWSTRPILYLNQEHFNESSRFRSFFLKTVRRYKQHNLNVDKLITTTIDLYRQDHVDELLNAALELEPKELDLRLSYFSVFLPSQVFASKSLTQISVMMCKIDPINEGVRCSHLTSLVLHHVVLTDSVLRDILVVCPLIENLGLLNVYCLKNIQISSHSLRNLDVCCEEFEDIQISSPSVRYLKLKLPRCKPFQKIQVNVPNISRFEYGTYDKWSPDNELPFLSFSTTSREWESDIKLVRRLDSVDASWFEKLRTFLHELSLSRVSLHIQLSDKLSIPSFEEIPSRRYFQGIPCSPIPVVDNLTVCGCDSSYKYTGLLRCLFRSCHPKFIRECACGYQYCTSGRRHLRKSLMQQNDKDLRLVHVVSKDLNEVDVEVFEEKMMEWHNIPFVKLKDVPATRPGDKLIRFRLKWRV